MKEKVPCIIAGIGEQPRASPGQCSAFAGMVECRRTIVQPTVITAIITGKGHVQISKNNYCPSVGVSEFRGFEKLGNSENPRRTQIGFANFLMRDIARLIARLKFEFESVQLTSNSHREVLHYFYNRMCMANNPRYGTVLP